MHLNCYEYISNNVLSVIILFSFFPQILSL